MSFAGHVFDMIRRNKEDREKLDQLRGRGKDSRSRYSSHIPDISVEEYDRINQQLKEREKEELLYQAKVKYLIGGIAIVIVVVLWIIL